MIIITIIIIIIIMTIIIIIITHLNKPLLTSEVQLLKSAPHSVCCSAGILPTDISQ